MIARAVRCPAVDILGGGGVLQLPQPARLTCRVEDASDSARHGFPVSRRLGADCHSKLKYWRRAHSPATRWIDSGELTEAREVLSRGCERAMLVYLVIQKRCNGPREIREGPGLE